MAIRIQEHVSLRELTTLKIGGSARYFVSVATVSELKEAVSFAREKKLPIILLGGGSNVLLSDKELNAVVVKNEIRGVEWGLHGSDTERRQHGTDAELVVAGAGESWDGLVAEAVKRGLWGIENLSGIPGTVGAAPIQNIGAYGAEIKDVLAWIEIIDIRQGSTLPSVRLSLADCKFRYRDSIFKHREGKSLIVTRVALRLFRNGKPNLAYRDLQNYFAPSHSPLTKGALPSSAGGLLMPSLSAIRHAVLEIRSRKFPDLRTHGTAGSFFKNPIISQKQFNALKKKYPDLPGFTVHGTERNEANTEPTRNIKIPLAWVLDNICGLKGYCKGNVALFERQPIVLVNTGGATAEEMKRFSEGIARRVKEEIGIEIQNEVIHIS